MKKNQFFLLLGLLGVGGAVQASDKQPSRQPGESRTDTEKKPPVDIGATESVNVGGNPSSAMIGPTIEEARQIEESIAPGEEEQMLPGPRGLAVPKQVKKIELTEAQLEQIKKEVKEILDVEAVHVAELLARVLGKFFLLDKKVTLPLISADDRKVYAQAATQLLELLKQVSRQVEDAKSVDDFAGILMGLTFGAMPIMAQMGPGTEYIQKIVDEIVADKQALLISSKVVVQTLITTIVLALQSWIDDLKKLEAAKGQ